MISSQSGRRGGLGSNALVTFTLRNNNRYAVEDIEITCAFVRRDGSHLTDRSRLIPEPSIRRAGRPSFACISGSSMLTRSAPNARRRISFGQSVAIIHSSRIRWQRSQKSDNSR
jgi:hypothetical protein